MRQSRARIRNMVIALGLITLMVPAVRHVILAEGQRANYRLLAMNARRTADSHQVRMPDGRVLRDHRWERVAEKYERAARYPWLPLLPDPPSSK